MRLFIINHDLKKIEPINNILPLYILRTMLFYVIDSFIFTVWHIFIYLFNVSLFYFILSFIS
jgi:hypothetical protein